MKLRMAIVILGLVGVVPCLGLGNRDDAAAEKLGFKLAIQAWTFQRLKPPMTFFEIVDKAAGLGIEYLETGENMKVKPGSNAAFGVDMDDALWQEVQKKLADAGGLKIASFFVKLPPDEAAARKVFAWAKKMGVDVLVTETTPSDVHEKLCKEYNLMLSLHNHPKTWPPEQVLAACQERCKLIGSCADTGHWMRADRVPVDALKMLEGRILHVHMKDLDGFGKAHDVPWGTGKADAKGIMAELKRQGYRGYFCIEYEYGDMSQLATDLPRCVEFFDKTAAELLKTSPDAGAKGLKADGSLRRVNPTRPAATIGH